MHAGCAEGEVRLFGGTDSNEGRVEICKSDKWSTMCDSKTENVAKVVCRQLGLNPAGTYAVSL